MKRFTIIVAAVLLSATTMVSQTIWKADKAHSQIRFSVVHMLISEVEGNFIDFEASMTQPNEGDFSGSTVEATIKAASINTDNEFRDKHLRSDDFFNADSFPTIIFKSTKFEKSGDNSYLVTGNLTIRSETKPVVLTARMTGMIETRGSKRIGFKATTTIDRFEFGTKWNRALETGGLVVSKAVDVTLLFEFGEVKPEAINPK